MQQENSPAEESRQFPSTIISLIVFDGDDTLWFSLDGAYISGVDPWDEGRQDYTFHQTDRLTIQRNDGPRFQLYPEVPDLLIELSRRNILLSLASFNHFDPVMNALGAFGIEHFFIHPIVEWHSQKDKMLKSVLHACSEKGFLVSPETTLFIDDDMKGIYRSQMASSGIHFLQRGVDIHDLSQLLDHPSFHLAPVQKSLI